MNSLNEVLSNMEKVGLSDFVKNIKNIILSSSDNNNEDTVDMKKEMEKYLYNKYKGLLDREDFELPFEIAVYWFANDYHSGQSSEGYSILSKSPYTPSRLTNSIEDEDDEIAKDMYTELEEKFKNKI
jgi:hypothetical protein